MAEPTVPESRWVVEHSEPAQRLDVWLRGRLPSLSRGALQRLIEQGDLRVDGRRVKPTHAPRSGEVIEIRWPLPRPAEARPEAIPLDILFEDDWLLILNKAAGLVVHPSAGHHAGTLVNALLHHCAGRLSGIGGVARPGIVHRLDKDTSGCLVVAKDDATHLALSSQFAGRELEKVYQALACGVVMPAAGDIHAAIGRHPVQRKRMAVAESSGREAWTSYQVIERLRGATRLEARLHTGRTHQLRVHFKHLGFPLLGDDTYGRRQNQRFTELTGLGAPRQMLHAERLVFNHPHTGRRIACLAPWPADFAAMIEALRGR